MRWLTPTLAHSCRKYAAAAHSVSKIAGIAAELSRRRSCILAELRARGIDADTDAGRTRVISAIGAARNLTLSAA